MILKSATLSAVALLLTVGAASAQQQDPHGDGSSTVFPVTEAMAEEFQKASKGIKVVVGNPAPAAASRNSAVATPTFRTLRARSAQVEAADCKKNGIEFIELPIALDALAVMVNPKNDLGNGSDCGRAEEDLAARGAGQDHELESGSRRLSGSSARLYGAGVDFRHLRLFHGAIVGKEHSSRGDFTASEDDNVLVQGIAGDINALGFFGLAYYHENEKQAERRRHQAERQGEGRPAEV